MTQIWRNVSHFYYQLQQVPATQKPATIKRGYSWLEGYFVRILHKFGALLIMNNLKIYCRTRSTCLYLVQTALQQQQ